MPILLSGRMHASPTHATLRAGVIDGRIASVPRNSLRESGIKISRQ
jgi:hypothetical protein